MKKIAFTLLLFSLSSVIQVSAYADYCFSSGITGFCYFTGLANSSSPHSYFHCTSDNSYIVKFYNHNVLISGFSSAGTITLSGSEIKKMFNKHYFEVMHHDGHHGAKYVGYVSVGKMHCSIGTGGRPEVYPGSFGLNAGL